MSPAGLSAWWVVALVRLLERRARASGALITACTLGFRATLGLGVSSVRCVAAAAALATIPVGTERSAAAQLAMLTLIVVALVLEGSRPVGVTQA